MYSDETQDIEWYLPDPRTIIPLDGFHVSRSLKKRLRSGKFNISVDQDFLGVMRACADRREGTWINQQFYDVYGELNKLGYAHSVEVWLDARLVGGTYGVSIGKAFMAESMFHYETDASKVALYYLIELLNRYDFQLLDVQFLTPHLSSLGAVEITNDEYQRRLKSALAG